MLWKLELLIDELYRQFSRIKDTRYRIITNPIYSSMSVSRFQSMQTPYTGKPMSPHTRNENTSPDTGQRSHYMVPGGPKMLTNTLTYDKTQNNSQTLTFLHLSTTKPGGKDGFSSRAMLTNKNPAQNMRCRQIW